MTAGSDSSTSHILPGVIDHNGKIRPVPTLVTIGPDGNITGHRPLYGHEPPFTTPIDALLHLPTLTLRHL